MSVYEANNEMTQLLSFFSYDHLPPHLQVVSEQFHQVAHQMVGGFSVCPEVYAGLRKLLEAKDCFVRAAIIKKQQADEIQAKKL